MGCGVFLLVGGRLIFTSVCRLYVYLISVCVECVPDYGPGIVGALADVEIQSRLDIGMPHQQLQVMVGYPPGPPIPEGPPQTRPHPWESPLVC